MLIAISHNSANRLSVEHLFLMIKNRYSTNNNRQISYLSIIHSPLSSTDLSVQLNLRVFDQNIFLQRYRTAALKVVCTSYATSKTNSCRVTIFDQVCIAALNSCPNTSIYLTIMRSNKVFSKRNEYSFKKKYKKCTLKVTKKKKSEDQNVKLTNILKYARNCV